MSNINSRISDIIAYFGLNTTSFSAKIGLSNNVTIGNIVGGRLSKPSFDIIEKILLSFDSINVEWLILGKGEMLKKEKSEQDINYLLQIIREQRNSIEVANQEIGSLKYQLKAFQKPTDNHYSEYSSPLSIAAESKLEYPKPKKK